MWIPYSNPPKHRRGQEDHYVALTFDLTQPREAALYAMWMDEYGYCTTQVCYDPQPYRALTSEPCTRIVMWCDDSHLATLQSFRATNAALGQLGAYQ